MSAPFQQLKQRDSPAPVTHLSLSYRYAELL